MERGCDFESDSNRAEPTPVGDDEVNPATPLARVAITRRSELDRVESNAAQLARVQGLS